MMDFETCVDDERNVHRENDIEEHEKIVKLSKATLLSQWDDLQNALKEAEAEIEINALTKETESVTDPYAEEWRIFKEKRNKELEEIIKQLHGEREIKIEINISTSQAEPAQQTVESFPFVKANDQNEKSFALYNDNQESTVSFTFFNTNVEMVETSTNENDGN